MPISRAMTPMTTSSSTSVKPNRVEVEDVLPKIIVTSAILWFLDRIVTLQNESRPHNGKHMAGETQISPATGRL